MAKKKKQKKGNPIEALPEFHLDDRAKRSIGIVVIFLFGLLSLLGLFNLSGQAGLFLSKWLTLIFGFGRFLVPLVFFFWGILLAKDKTVEIRFADYLGLILLFISYQTLFHFFFDQANWLVNVKLGLGGGYLGYYFSLLFFYLFGFWGGMIVLIALFLVALVIVFNTSLSKIIGRDSAIGSIFKTISSAFSGLFSTKEIESESEEQVSQASVLEDWSEKALEMVVDEEDEADEEELKKVHAKISKRQQVKQEKIPLPKRRIRIDLPLELLNPKSGKAIAADTEHGAAKIKHTLENFGINVEMAETKVGPTVTQYTFKPAQGVKVSRIITLNNDLSLALAAHPIRIEAPIPGKSLVGVEVPNRTKAMVGLREILEDDVFKNRKHNMMIGMFIKPIN